MTISKFLQLIESTSDPQLVQDKYLFSDLLFSFPFKRDEQEIQFLLTGDFFLSSSKPLEAITRDLGENTELFDMSPLDPKISIISENIYRIESIYREYHL